LSARVRWAGEGEAAVVAVDGVHVTVRSTRPFPPGAPAQGTLDEAHAFTLKVAGSRKEADAFVVRGRLVSATVAVREAFTRAVATGVDAS
jgi:hypothetical protein